ncbi:MAG: cysteine sulfinate desulfinase [Bacteroidetes bacterium CG2_30_32_10]|nr:MAG: cysteine sulfinate desulfinase [Bacteroidetes bacterium CG2_30_32_10]
MFDINKIRQDFPILKRTVYNRPLVYFDNAATTQKPQVVIDAISKYYEQDNANIHRGVHYLSQMGTQAYEESRKAVKTFINAEHDYEIIFTRGATESINLVASSFGKKYLKQGDEILLSGMEHHSNIVPWQIICEEKEAKLAVIPITDTGELNLTDIEKRFTDKTKLLAITHVSNALGTINPIKRLIDIAHKYNIPVLIDGAQAVSHLKVDVKELDCDFYCFSGHKVYGPTGIGVLYGKEKLLEEMPPYQGGGEMIRKVTFEKTEYSSLPFKFEAGTPNIADGIALKAALDYVSSIGLFNIALYEAELLHYATNQLLNINGLKIYGTAKEKAAVISFLLENIHPYDAGTILDKLGVAVRTGHHCAQPIMDWYGIPGTIRASFALYNTKEEIDGMIKSLQKVIEMFS